VLLPNINPPHFSFLSSLLPPSFSSFIPLPPLCLTSPSSLPPLSLTSPSSHLSPLPPFFSSPVTLTTLSPYYLVNYLLRCSHLFSSVNILTFLFPHTGPLDAEGCLEFLTESIAEFYRENRPNIEGERAEYQNSEKRPNIEGNIAGNQSFDDILRLSAAVVPLCVGYTGAEMKLIIRKASLMCLAEGDGEREGGNEGERVKEGEGVREDEGGKKEVEEGKDARGNDKKQENEVEEGSAKQGYSSLLLTLQHFQTAVLSVRPSVSREDVTEFENWARERK
jgi:Vps4 C terminal oligomerisation domain